MTTDLILDKTSVASADDAMLNLVMNQILAKAPPVVAEGLFLASTVHSFTVTKFNFLRPHDIERNEKLVQRLAKFSFVIAIEREGRETQYNLTELEREWLQLHWINNDPAAFLNAHRMALGYYQANPDPDEFIQRQFVLYHQLIVDYAAARPIFAQAFRSYTSERRFAAVERLLSTAREVRPYLAALNSPHLAEFDYWLVYMDLRFRQYRGEWQETKAPLHQLLTRTDLPVVLVPFVHRAYGESLKRDGSYVEAIEQFGKALALFRTQPDSEIEQGFTMFALGEAHTNLATSARGYRESIPLRIQTIWQRLRDLLNYPPFPLLLYLSFFFGVWTWLPRSWSVFKDQDWIIARLFAVGYRWYTQARSLYQRIEYAPGLQSVQEHMANLYLTLGDARRAEPILRELLASENVGQYRQATVQVALGHALVRLHRDAEAIPFLEQALPIVKLYDDKEAEARACAFMAEALFMMGQRVEGLEQFERALRLYQSSGNVVSATEVAERLQRVGEDNRLTQKEREFASSTSGAMSRRHYLVRFEHPVLRAFRRLTYMSFATILFLIPLMVIRLDTAVTLTPDINFFAFPFLEAQLSANTLNYGPSLSQAIVLVLKPATDANVFAWIAAVVMLVYFLLYTLVGLLVIIRTPLKTVQAATRAETVRFDLTGFTVGYDDTGRRASWHEIKAMTRANVSLLGQLVRDHSVFVVESPTRRITIRGTTAWYDSLIQQIERYAPAAATRQDTSYHVGWGRLSVAYAISLMLVVLYAILVKAKPELLFNTIPFTPYSFVDLYPFYYLGLFLGPVYWGIVRPLRNEVRAKANNPLPWIVLGVIVALGVVRFFFYRRPLFTIPDLYPQLFIVLLAWASAQCIWQARSVMGTPTFTNWQRRGAGFAAAIIILLMTIQLGQEVLARHFLIVGNWHRDHALELEQTEREAEFWQAIMNYDRAIALAPARWSSWMGFVSRRTFTWVQAHNNRGTLYAQLGDFAAATQDYKTIIRYLPETHTVPYYASQAVAYVSWSAQLLDEGNSTLAMERYWQAQAAFDAAIAQEPHHSDFYVWRGVSDHNISGDLQGAVDSYNEALEWNPNNVDAWLGLGWAFYQQAEDLRQLIAVTEEETAKDNLQTDANLKYQAALQYFAQAAIRAPQDANIQLAIGYAHYALQEFPASLTAWEAAAAIAPDDAVMIVSRGTGYWRLGTLPSCASSRATDEEKAISGDYLSKALEDLDLALTLNPEDAFTYRTRAQIEFILAGCASLGYDANTQYRKAIESYTQALILEPDNDLYLIFRGRIGYLLARNLFLAGPENDVEARAILDQVIADIAAAYAIDPSDDPNKQTATWYHFVIGPTGDAAWPDFHVRRGQAQLQSETPDYAQAYHDLSYAVPFVMTNLDLPFQAGLAALAVEEYGDAAAFYDTGIARIALAQDVNNFAAALDAFSALVQSDPTLEITAFYTQFQNAPALQQNLALQNNDWYWHYRARFGFTVARRLFEAGNENGARSVLNGVNVDIEKAYALAPTANRNGVWYEFYRAGGWGWLYLRRGDTRLEMGMIAEAWQDYGAAADLIPADNEVTAADAAEAALKYNQTTFALALQMLQAGEIEQAETLYEQGIGLAREREDQNVVTEAAANLQTLLREQPELSNIAQPFVLLLEGALAPPTNENDDD